MTDPARWLDERDPPAPAPVRQAMEEQLAGTDPADPLPRRLAHGAVRALKGVVSRPSDRSTAMTLLAADALLTYACEAAVEAGPDALEGITAELDFQRFTDLIPEQS